MSVIRNISQLWVLMVYSPALTDFLFDHEKLSDKNSLYSKVQKLTQCSKSEFLSDINAFHSYFSVRYRTVSRTRTPFSLVLTHRNTDLKYLLYIL